MDSLQKLLFEQDNPLEAVAYWFEHVQAHPFYFPDKEHLAVLLLTAQLASTPSATTANSDSMNTPDTSDSDHPSSCKNPRKVPVLREKAGATRISSFGKPAWVFCRLYGNGQRAKNYTVKGNLPDGRPFVKSTGCSLKAMAVRQAKTMWKIALSNYHGVENRARVHPRVPPDASDQLPPK